MIEDEQATLDDQSEVHEITEDVITEENEEINYKESSIEEITKLKRRTITAIISFIVIIFSSFFDKYNDFDVAMTSFMFKLFLGITVLFLMISWVYYIIKGEDLDNLEVYKEVLDIYHRI